MHRSSIITAADEKAACYALRAAEYVRYYRNVPSDQFMDEFDRVTTADGKRASYLVAVREEETLVGTLRLVVSRHPRHPELRSELAELMEFSWGEVARLVGTTPEKLMVGEAGRFAVTRCRDTLKAKWLTVTAVGKVALDLGLHVVLAVMAPAVERIVRRAGIRFHRLAEANLRRDHTDVNRLLLRYHDYFLPSLRRMGLDVDASRLAQVSPAALEMLVAGSADGPMLWWITPAEMANAPIPRADGGVPA